MNNTIVSNGSNTNSNAPKGEGISEDAIRLPRQGQSTADSGFGISIADILKDAYEQDGKQAPTGPVQNRAWSSLVGEGQCTWQEDFFGSLEVRVGNVVMGTPKQEGMASIAQLYPGLIDNATPSYVSLTFRVQAWPGDIFGVRVLEARDGTVTNVTKGGIAPLNVGVEWRDGDHPGVKVPHSRQKGKDNTDFVFFRRDGKFIQVQASVVTRHGRMWLCLQEVYSGHVVTTTQAKARELGLTHVARPYGVAALIAPLYPENAFHGSDYLRTFSAMGPKIVDHAFTRGDDAIERLSRCTVASWNPQKDLVLSDKMRENGWQTAQVMFFNLVVGHGMVLCQDGKPCFVHFSRVIDDQGKQIAAQGQMPMLQPMKQIAVKYREEGGKRQATAIRVL